jgi:hypothetical protein
MVGVDVSPASSLDRVICRRLTANGNVPGSRGELSIVWAFHERGKFAVMPHEGGDQQCLENALLTGAQAAKSYTPPAMRKESSKISELQASPWPGSRKGRERKVALLWLLQSFKVAQRLVVWARTPEGGPSPLLCVHLSQRPAG